METIARPEPLRAPSPAALSAAPPAPRRDLLSADIAYWVQRLADHHGFDASAAWGELVTAPPHVVASIDCPEGLTALGFYLCEVLGGTSAARFMVEIH